VNARRCPFCGSDAVRFVNLFARSPTEARVLGTHVACNECGAKGPTVGLAECRDRDLALADARVTALLRWNAARQRKGRVPRIHAE